MHTDITANLNNTVCLVKRQHFDYDTFINICSGKHIDIAWGMGNWLDFIGNAAAILLITTIVVGLVIGAVFLIREALSSW